jgi:diguanylate cyclase (GGDEF)-like protein
VKCTTSGGGRRTIGLLVSQATSSYDHGLYKGVRAAAAARGLDVVTLLCASLDSTIWHPFESQNNLLYSLPSKDVFDGLVLVPAILYNYSTPERAGEVLAQYRGIPMVTISEAISSHPGIFVDNVSGVSDLVRHICERHGRRRFAFASGPAGNADAVDRLQGFYDGIVECGLDFDDRMIFEGNFWLTGGRAGAHAFFDGENAYKPDAIICANDYMAYGAREVIQALGLRVPEDVILTGFDNEPDSRFTDPPLTTIAQPLGQMADCAVEILVGMMQGQEVQRRTVLPTRILYRRSCGCHDGGMEAIAVDRWETEIGDDDLTRRINAWVSKASMASTPDPESSSALLDSLYDILSLARNRGKVSQVRSIVPALLDTDLNSHSMTDRAFSDGVQAVLFETREMEMGLQAAKNTAVQQREVVALQNIITVHTAEEMFERFVDELPSLGVTIMFLNLFSKPFEHAARQKWAVPSRARCVFAYVAGKRLDLPREGTPFKTARLVPDVPELAGSRGHLIALSCFFKQEVYGFMVVESATDDMVALNNLATQVSSAYHSILGYRQLEKSARSLRIALQELQVSNRRLDELSTRDTLTGLYNRRGFELIGEKLHDIARRNESEYLLFFADLDGLKAINDTWGHRAGDEAISDCADILRRTFRSADLVARLGGDEFTILVGGASHEGVHGMLARLAEALDERNDRRWGRPYRVELSVGYVFLSDCPGRSFSEVIEMADAELYREKQERKRAAQMQSVT